MLHVFEVTGDCPPAPTHVKVIFSHTPNICMFNELLSGIFFHFLASEIQISGLKKIVILPDEIQREGEQNISFLQR